MNKLLILLLIIFLVGCGSSAPTNFYTLQSDTPIKQERGISKTKTLMVGPIEIPKYLEKPQMVLTDSQYQLYYSDFNWWSSPLEDNIKNVMVMNLIGQVPRLHIIEFPGSLTDKPDFRVQVNFLEFDTTTKGVSILKAQWRLLNKNRQTLYSKTVYYTQQIPMPLTYAAVAKGMSDNLSRLSGEIASTLGGAL